MNILKRFQLLIIVLGVLIGAVATTNAMESKRQRDNGNADVPPAKRSRRGLVIPHVIPIAYHAENDIWNILLGRDTDFSEEWDTFWPFGSNNTDERTLDEALAVFNTATNNLYSLDSSSLMVGPFECKNKNNDTTYSFYFFPVKYISGQTLYRNRDREENSRFDNFCWIPVTELYQGQRVTRTHMGISPAFDVKISFDIEVSEHFLQHLNTIWPQAAAEFNNPCLKIQSLSATSIRFFYDDNPERLLIKGDPTSGQHNYSKYCTDNNNTTWINAPHLFSFLGNFFPSLIEMKINGDSFIFPNAEAPFQAHKIAPTESNAYAQIVEFENASNGLEACNLGRKVQLRSDWEAIKYATMYNIVYQKFSQSADLTAQLKATGNAQLIEWTTRDDVWGVIRDYHNPDDQRHNQQALNWLGQILMDVRAALP